MSTAESRRGFLRGLTSLPLIGGSVSLIGAPTAVAGEPSKATLVAYGGFLEGESRILRWQLAHMLGWPPGEMSRIALGPTDYHFPASGSWLDQPMPSTRAALVLAAVGAKPEANGWVSRQIWRERPEA